MKKNLRKKLQNYSMLAGATLVLGSSANAQIVYTDIEDVTINAIGEFIEVDFNDDETVDMQVNIMTLQTDAGYVYATAVRAMVPPLEVYGGVEGFSLVLTNGYAGALDSGYAVSATKSFKHNSWKVDMAEWWKTSDGFESTNGNWLNTVDVKFLGVKFKIEDAVHYGWIRVSTVANAEDDLHATVHDFAYESTPDTQILTGDMGPPSCSEISLTSVTQTTADILATPSINGNLFYVLLLESADAPNAEEVLAGTGSGGAEAITSGSVTGTGGEIATINLTELTENTSYTAYLVLDDGVTVKTLSIVYDTDFATLETGFEQLNSNNIDIFPNPSKGVFNINVENSQELNVTISDVTGKIVLQKIINSTDNQINMNNQTKGIYKVQINNGNSIITKKIILN